jgi:predicted dehydrogenase
MPPVRLGVIGCSVIGSKHIEAASEAEHIDLTAIADLRSDVAKDMARHFNVAKVYSEA